MCTEAPALAPGSEIHLDQSVDPFGSMSHHSASEYVPWVSHVGVQLGLTFQAPLDTSHHVQALVSKVGSASYLPSLPSSRRGPAVTKVTTRWG